MKLALLMLILVTQLMATPQVIVPPDYDTLYGVETSHKYEVTLDKQYYGTLTLKAYTRNAIGADGKPITLNLYNNFHKRNWTVGSFYYDGTQRVPPTYEFNLVTYYDWSDYFYLFFIEADIDLVLLGDGDTLQEFTIHWIDSEPPVSVISHTPTREIIPVITEYYDISGRLLPLHTNRSLMLQVGGTNGTKLTYTRGVSTCQKNH